MGTTNDDSTEENVQTTTEHALVRRLIEDREGYPAHLASSEGTGDSGLLQVGLAERDQGEDLKELSWEEFFEEFEEKDLAFAYQEGGEDDPDEFTYLRKRDDN